MERVITTVPKNAVEEIRISLTTSKGRELVDVCVYFQADDGSWKPTRKGICLTVEHWPKLRDALVQVDARLPAEGSPPGRRRSPRGGVRG